MVDSSGGGHWGSVVVGMSVTIWGSSGILPVKLETTLRYLGEIECVIQSVYSGAKWSRPTMMSIAEELSQRVYETNRYKRMPEWARDKVSFIHRSVRKNTMDKYVHMFYIGLDGRMIPTYKSWDLFTEEEREFIRAGGNLEIKHIWMKEETTRDDNGVVVTTLTPTDRVYWSAE